MCFNIFSSCPEWLFIFVISNRWIFCVWGNKNFPLTEVCLINRKYGDRSYVHSRPRTSTVISSYPNEKLMEHFERTYHSPNLSWKYQIREYFERNCVYASSSISGAWRNHAKKHWSDSGDRSLCTLANVSGDFLMCFLSVGKCFVPLWPNSISLGQ